MYFNTQHEQYRINSVPWRSNHKQHYQLILYTMSSSNFVHIDENVVQELLDWPLVIHAVDQALRSVVDTSDTTPETELPKSVLNARTSTATEDGKMSTN